jgi:hypothetical protein
VAWEGFVGPLNARAVPGYRLLESERRPEELEFGEDMLYAAAVHAGWLAGEPDEVVDLPDVQIICSATPRPTSSWWRATFGRRGDTRPWPMPDDERLVAHPFQVLVIDIETGEITDSGSTHQAPDLGSLGDVVTHRDTDG